MPIAAILQALAYAAKYGPEVVTAGKQIVAAISSSGHPDLTPDDIAQLNKFVGKTADDYLREAGGAPALPGAAARSDAPAAT